MRMLSQVASVVFVISSASAAAFAAQDGGAPSPQPNKNAIPACMSVTTDARYVPYGYNHVVIVTNGCTKPATCSVATDVNPTSQSVDVPAQQTVEVLTFMSAASSQFVARVSCKTR